MGDRFSNFKVIGVRVKLFTIYRPRPAQWRMPKYQSNVDLLYILIHDDTYSCIIFDNFSRDKAIANRVFFTRM